MTLSFLLIFLISCDSRPPQVSQNSTFYRRLGTQPETLHPIRASDSAASIILNLAFDQLLIRNLDTYEWEPSLAEKWQVSEDHKVYTFHLRKNVKWSDGKPLTAHDVAFSLSAYQDISYGGAHRLPYFENIDRCKVIDNHTIRFYSKERRWSTFDNLVGELKVLPQHIYKDKKKKMNRTFVGSGPYQLIKYDGNKQILLKKNKNWWGDAVFKGQHRFAKVIFRVIPSVHDALLRMEQGQLDFIQLSAESYFKKTSRPPWGKAIIKKKVQNKKPKSYNFVGWNFKKYLFQDKKVRHALSLLMNRSLMNEKFQNNSYALVNGPGYFGSEYIDSNVHPVLFNPKKAMKLLTEAGWKDSNQDGVLDKVYKGQLIDFQFTLIFPAKHVEKYLTLYQEDLKTHGIKMSLKLMEWVSFMKMLDEKEFDAVFLAWSSSDVDWYPKQIWHSESSQMNGSNFITYSHPEVDRLIDQSDLQIHRSKRIEMLKKTYRLIAEDYPYVFMFSSIYSFYAHSKKVKMVKPTYNYDLGLRYWWFE